MKYIIGCLYIFGLFSCASVSKTDISQNTTKPKHKVVHTKKVNALRTVSSDVNPVPTLDVATPEDLNKMIESKMTAFKDSNLIANENNNDLNRSAFVERKASMTFPLKNDYLVQLELFKVPQTAKESVYEALYTYWGMLHIFSLGIIPITKTDKFNIRTTFFDKIGKVVLQKQTLNEARVWYWSPLLLFKGLHMLTSYRELYSSEIEIDSEKSSSSFPSTFLR